MPITPLAAPRRLIRNPLGSGLNIALYHHLTDQPGEIDGPLGVATAPGLFEAHVQRLARDYEIVDLATALSGRLPRRPLLITFDDGYRSILELALPVLARLGVPSVFFLSAAFLEPGSLPLDHLLAWLSQRVEPEALEPAVTGRPAAGVTVTQLIDLVADLSYERRMRLGEQLAERHCVDRGAIRAESGLFLDVHELPLLTALGCEVANHTQSHVFCRCIADEAIGNAELVDHARKLERWAGAPVRAFSYPYGRRRDATPLVERLLSESGHEASFLVESRPNPLRHAGRVWNRVSLDGCATSRLTAQLEVFPHLRAFRDRVRAST